MMLKISVTLYRKVAFNGCILHEFPAVAPHPSLPAGGLPHSYFPSEIIPPPRKE